MKHIVRFYLPACILLLITVSSASAQTVTSIAGFVTAESTGDSLAAVNIMVEGTDYGAALAWAQPEEPPGSPADVVNPNPMFPFEVLEGVSRLCPFWIDVAESLKRDQVFLTAGQYAVTPDDKPIIGPHPDISGLFFNLGYSGHGVMTAPGGGRLLAGLVTGVVADADNPFSFRRLAGLEFGAGEHTRLL